MKNIMNILADNIYIYIYIYIYNNGNKILYYW